jgi:PIN domain nuclease of toxin-antitoxin system
MPNVRSNDLLIFDAYPLVAVLLGEPAGPAVAALLAESRGESGVSTINAAEVVDGVARSRQVDAHDVASTIDLWVEGGLTIFDLDWACASRAAALRAGHYHRTRMPVSLADCTAVALAEELGATLVTSDAPMLRLAREIGVSVHALAKS